MADPALIWMQFLLLFVRYPRKNGLCTIFVIYCCCFIPAFALPDKYYANLEFSKLEKQQSKGRSTQLEKSATLGELHDQRIFRGSFARIGSVKEAEGRLHWVHLFHLILV
jgi:hypothetical protein